MAKATADSLSGLANPLQIKAEEVAAAIPKAEPTKRYWVGTTDESPFRTIHVVIDFPEYEGRLTADDKGNPVKPPFAGRIMSLTPSQVNEIKRRVTQKVVRWYGQEGRQRAELRSMFKTTGKDGSAPQKDDRFILSANDVPLGRYIYMVELADDFTPDRTGAKPPPLVR